MNALFNLCVAILLGLSRLFGVSYQTINVVIFCILWPTLTLWMAWRIHSLKHELRYLRGK